MEMRFNADTMDYELISDEQGAFNKMEVLYSSSKEAIASLFAEKVMGIDPLVHKTGIELGLDNRQNITDLYLFDGKGKVSQHFSSAQLSSAPFSAEEISASFKKLREDGYTKLTEKENSAKNKEKSMENTMENTNLREMDYNNAKDSIVTLINGEVGKLLSEEAIEALWVVNRELIELRSNADFPEQTHTVEISDYDVLIDGKVISDEVFNEVLEYSLVDRDNEIKELQRMLGEALQGNRTNDANLMEQDIDELKELTNLSDKFVFSSQSTNEYVSFTNNPERFNELCQMALDEQEKIDLGKIPFSRLDAEDIIVSHPLYDTIEGIYKPEVFNNLPDVKYLLNNYDIGNAKDYRMDMKNNNDVLDWDTFIKQVDDFIDKNGIPEEKRTTKKKPKGARP